MNHGKFMDTRLLNKTQQLERMLRRNFSSAEWSPGARLPSEDALMELFGVSRPSMREALNTLAADGVVVRKHGSGTYLVRRPVNRIEVFMRLENIATVAGYWYRDMLHAFQALGLEQGIQVEAVMGFGETTDKVIASLERKLSRPSGSDLVGTASLLMSTELDDELMKLVPQPVSLLRLFPSGKPGEVVLDYQALADAFRAIMLEHGYDDFTLIFSDDPPEKNGIGTYRVIHAMCDRITGGDASRQLGVVADFIEEADFQNRLEERFLEWYHSPRRTKAAVFFDDGIFSSCCRIMFRHGIRIPEDLAVLTHANVGRLFDFPFVPFRIGFDAKVAARAMWDTIFDEPGRPRPIAPTLMPGDSLPTIHSKSTP